MTKHVSVKLIYVTKSQGAIGFEMPEGGWDLIWIPRCQLRNLESILDSEYSNGDEVEIEIPQWLAVKKGMDPYCEELEDEAH